MAGKFFDEWQIGETITHEIRRTVTEADNIWFCSATYNPAQIHIDFEYCRQTEFKQPLVNSIFTLGLVIGLTVQDTTLGTTVLEKRESKSRPNAGIVTFLHQGFNQRGEEVCTCTRQALMLKAPT